MTNPKSKLRYSYNDKTNVNIDVNLYIFEGLYTSRFSLHVYQSKENLFHNWIAQKKTNNYLLIHLALYRRQLTMVKLELETSHYKC